MSCGVGAFGEIKIDLFNGIRSGILKRSGCLFFDVNVSSREADIMAIQ